MNAKISVTCYKSKILSSLPLFFVNAVSLHYFKILFNKLADELGIKEDVTTYIARHVRSNRPESSQYIKV